MGQMSEFMRQCCFNLFRRHTKQSLCHADGLASGSKCIGCRIIIDIQLNLIGNAGILHFRLCINLLKKRTEKIQLILTFDDFTAGLESQNCLTNR